MSEGEDRSGDGSVHDTLVDADVSAIAAQAVGEAHLNYPVPRYMSQPQCEAMLRQMIV